jgi:hypothetical protein
MPSSGLLAPPPSSTLVCLTRSLEAVMMARHFRGMALVPCSLGFQVHAQSAEREATRPLNGKRDHRRTGHGSIRQLIGPSAASGRPFLVRNGKVIDHTPGLKLAQGVVR